MYLKLNSGARVNRSPYGPEERAETTASCRRATARIVAMLFVSFGICVTASAQLPTGFVDEPVLVNMTAPMGVAFLPDGSGLVWEKAGTILSFDPSSVPAVPQPYLALAHVESGGERGLLDVTIDPDFALNHWFYVLYVDSVSGRTRVSRFEEQGGVGNPASEMVLWQSTGVWISCCHYGGGIDVAPDGSLWFTTGEQFDGAQAQDLTTSLGKLFRIHTDGTIPADNPFLSTPGALESIYAYGLRNPFRARFDDPTGRFYIGEVGGNAQATATEDIHVGVGGANYGWPACEGDCGNPLFEPPLFSYPHGGSGASVTGGIVYRGAAFPAQYDGAYFYADFVRHWLRYLTLDSSGQFVADTLFATNHGPVVAIEQGPDGALYLAHLDASGLTIFGGEVRRIRYVPQNAPPIITVASADATVGLAPLDVHFIGAAEDGDGDPLDMRWVFGDGDEFAGPLANQTYAANGPYSATFEVSDGTTTVVSDPILIQVGELPSVSIGAPTDGITFRFGDVLDYSAVGSDPDGVLSNASYSWIVRFVRPDSSHPALGPVQGAQGSFPIPLQGQGFSGDVYYEFVVTVTDADGLTATDSARAYPDKVDLLFDTVPHGIPVVVDGNVARLTPFLLDSLIAIPHAISAPAEACLDGQSLGFSSWSDGGGLSHSIIVPTVDETWIANYVPANGCPGQLIFDGTDDIARIPAVSLAGDFTLEARVYMQGEISNADGIVFDANSGNVRDINFFQGRARIFTGSPDWDVVVASTPHTPGTWVHYAFVRSGANLALYVNGVLDATGTWSGTFTFDTLGQANAGFLNGKLDEVRVWGTARTANEIAANQDQSVAPGSAGLLGYWSFDEAALSQQIDDQAPNGNHGTLGASAASGSDDPLRESSLPRPPQPAGGDLIVGRNRSLVFDGRADVARVPSFTLSGDFTFEAWVWLDAHLRDQGSPTLANGGAAAPSAQSRISASGTRVPERGGLLVDGQGLTMDAHFERGRLHLWAGATNGDVLIEDHVQPPDVWTHYAIVRSGSDLSLYVDGALDAVGTWAGSFAFDTLGSGADGLLDGGLDDVRLWTIARSAGDVAASHAQLLEPFAPGLLAYWTFDEPLGMQSLLDVSPNAEQGSRGADLSVGPDDPRRRPAPLGDGRVHGTERSMRFDGVDDLIRVPPISLVGDFTIEARVYLEGTVSNADGLVFDALSGNTFDINFFAGRARIWTGAPDGDVLIANTPHPPGAWASYAFVRSGVNLFLYVNGQLDATGTWAGTPTIDTLGKTGVGFLEGELNEVRLWDVARTGAEIAATHAGTVNPTTAGLLAYWSFDGAPGTQAVADHSPQGHDGTRGATAAVDVDDPVRN